MGMNSSCCLMINGKPIARNSLDCIEILKYSDIDGIQIENFLILKKLKKNS